MGGVLSVNESNIQQSFYNQVNELTKTVCNTVADNSITGQYIDISNSTVNNTSVGISTNNVVDASCVISSSMASTISNMLGAMVQQEAKTDSDLFGDFSFSRLFNVTDVVQSSTNVINQVNSSVCTAASYNPIKDQYIYAANTTINGNGGFLGISEKSNTSATCSMSNYMKNLSFNQTQANTGQKNISKGMFTVIFTALALIAGAIVLFVVVIALFGGGGYLVIKETEAKNSKK